jgi:hypothetical protein
VRIECVRSAKLHVARKELIGQPEKLQRTGREVVLPAEHVVGLPHEHVHVGIFQLHEGMPQSKHGTAEVGDLRCGRWGVLVAEEVGFQHGRRLHRPDLRRLQGKAQSRVANRELRTTIPSFVGFSAGHQRAADRVVVAPRGVVDEVSLHEAVESHRPSVGGLTHAHRQRRPGEPGGTRRWG